MELVRGPSKSTLQWLWLFGNINQISFYILGRKIRGFRCTLEKWFSCVYCLCKETFPMCWQSYFIDAYCRKRCLAASWLMIRRYYVIIKNSKELQYALHSRWIRFILSEWEVACWTPSSYFYTLRFLFVPRKLLIFFPQLVDFGCLSKTLPLRMKNNWGFRISELRTCCFRKEY